MTLRQFWEALMGRTSVRGEHDSRKYYETIASYKAVVDSSTEQLRSENDRKAREINEVFDDLSKVDD